MIKEIRKPDKKNVRGFLSPATPPNRFFDLLSMVRIIGALSDENLVLGGILPSTFFWNWKKVPPKGLYQYMSGHLIIQTDCVHISNFLLICKIYYQVKSTTCFFFHQI